MQTLSLKLKGLYTDPNNLGDSVPDGALEKATNIVADSDNIAEVRRGFSRLGGAFSDDDYRAEKYFIYQDQVIASYTGDRMGYYTDISLTGNTTTSSNVVFGTSTGLAADQYVYGAGIPANTKITSTNSVAVVIDNVATATALNASITCSGWINYASSQVPISDTFKIRSAEANENFYFTTDGGIQKLSAYDDSDAVDAGMPRGLDIVGTLSTVTGGFCSGNSQVAYRVVWGIKDDNDNVILGAPSNQNIVVNPAGGSDSQVSLVVTIPSTITVSNFIQIYRSKASALATISPTEDMQLVYENNPTAAEIAAGTLTVVDNTPYALMGAFLYTSPSEEGISQANEIPPYSRCLAAFKDSMFYGNTTAKHRLTITMVGVGLEAVCTANVVANNLISEISTAGVNSAWTDCLVQQSNGVSNIIAANSIIESNISANSASLDKTIAANMADLSVTISSPVTIAGVTYSPRSTESAANDYFKVYVAGTPSQDIADTAQSLVRVINATSSQSNVYAYYTSSIDDLPGEILIEEIDLGGDAFSATAKTFGTEWSPVLPASGTTVSSTSERQKNGIYFSKYQEPEAVPLFNNFKIGSAAKEILQMIPVRDSLFVLKEDGIWRILGATANDFRVEVVDLSTVLYSPESAVELNNQLFALTNQGVVIITETGVSIVSDPIEGDLQELFGSSLSTIKTSSFAVGYKTDRSYLLWIVAGSGDSTPTQCYRYNTIRGSWTRWNVGADAGILNTADDKIYLSDNASAYTLQERKAYDYTDSVDEKEQINITANSSTTITVSDASNFRVGDILYQSSSVWSKVTAVDSNNNTVTIATDFGATSWSNDSAVRYAYIPITIQWMPNSADNPGVMKLFKDVSVFMTDDGFTSFDLSFKTELDNNFESVTVNGNDLALWGLFPFGEIVWPGDSSSQGTFRTYTPLAKARGSLLTVKLEADIAYRRFGIQGISIPFSKGNEWVRK